MRRLGFKEEFDAAVNLFTSFGYFQKFSDDIKTLKGVARALKPGGLFLMDIIHGGFVKKNCRPRFWHEMEDHYLLEESREAAGGVFNTWTRVPKKGGRVLERSFYTRMYTRASLGAALKKAGLKPLKFWGAFSGRPLTSQTNRLIVLARKKG